MQHGDLRTDNILFGLDGDLRRATMIDFQTVRLGPPGIDPAYFLGSSLSTPTDADRTRPRWPTPRTPVRRRRRRLRPRRVLRGYREGALYAVYLFCGLSVQVASSERVDRVIADQTRRYADMAIDLEAPQLAGLM